MHDNQEIEMEKRQFGEKVFDEKEERARLPEEVVVALQKARTGGEPIDGRVADLVAFSLQEWAVEKGATHYCHWFHPITDRAAEKHHTLLRLGKEGDFYGERLVSLENGGKSFSSPGRRTIFEGRAHTSWNVGSPPFLLGNTLVIPTTLQGGSGEAFDKKTPMIRSVEALETQVTRILRLFGEKRDFLAAPLSGCEQEYYLVEKSFYNQRPDLVSCGRTLFGAAWYFEGELDERHLGLIPERIREIMESVEHELAELGVPVRTAHNELSPGQYELVLGEERVIPSVDHHMLAREVVRKTASKHGLVALFHERPFTSLEGSGLHLHWSLRTVGGSNLLSPERNPQENARFLLFCAALLRSLRKYSSLLHLSSASYGNGQRLHREESPSEKESLFVGEPLYSVFAHLAGKQVKNRKNLGEFKVGVSPLPTISPYQNDRNRTAPFSLTDGKLELRSLGASSSLTLPITVLNTVIAESLDSFASELEGKPNFQEALESLVSKTFRECFPILREGDQPIQEDKTVFSIPEALVSFTTSETVALFTKYKVFSRRELVHRQEIAFDQYVKRGLQEGKVALNLARTMVLPSSLHCLRDIGDASGYLPSGELDLVKILGKEIVALRKGIKTLDEALQKFPGEEELSTQAGFVEDTLLPPLNRLRSQVDRLEELVDDHLWPLPKNRELLNVG